MMKQYQLWYDAPAKDWNIALPLGNGRMGAMVFGGTVLERISLNEDSCWYGGFRDRVNPDAKKYLPVVRQLLKEDRIAEAQQLAEEALTATPDGERHYEVLCDLILQQLDGETPEGLHGMRNLRGQDMSRHERPVSGYRRALDITDGVHQVSYVRKEKQIRRECFLSVPHQLFAMHHEGFSSRVLLRRGAYVNRIDKVDEHTILLSGQAGDGGVQYMAMCRAVGEGVHVIGNTLHIGETADIYLASATSYRFADLRAACLSRLETATADGYAAVKAAHVAEHRAVMARCTLALHGEDALDNLPTDQRLARYAQGNADNGLEELYFAFGRYLLAGCSRPGTLPANLQGIWNDDFHPAWDGKYTININTEMNYWCAEVCNLSEMHLPLFDHLRRMQPHGAQVALGMYGANGWVAHHNTDLWGDCAPQDTYCPATYWPMGAAWLCLHIAEHYRYTLDADFLRTNYDLMTGAADFFLDTAILREDGMYTVSPSSSPENVYITPSGESGTLTDAAAMDGQILHALMSAIEECGAVLGADTARYTAFKQKLDPVQVEAAASRSGCGTARTPVRGIGTSATCSRCIPVGRLRRIRRNGSRLPARRWKSGCPAAAVTPGGVARGFCACGRACSTARRRGRTSACCWSARRCRTCWTITRRSRLTATSARRRQWRKCWCRATRASCACCLPSRRSGRRAKPSASARAAATRWILHGTARSIRRRSPRRSAAR